MFPQEPGQFWVKDDRLSQLKDEHKDVEIHGQVKYTSVGNNYTTEILIELVFSDVSDEVLYSSNTSAT